MNSTLKSAGSKQLIAGFVYILPSAGLYLTQHFLECSYYRNIMQNMILYFYYLHFKNTFTLYK